MPHQSKVYVAKKRYQRMRPGDTVLSREGGLSPDMVRKHRGGALPLALILKLVARGILELVLSGDEEDGKGEELTHEEQVAAEVDEIVTSEV